MGMGMGMGMGYGGGPTQDGAMRGPNGPPPMYENGYGAAPPPPPGHADAMGPPGLPPFAPSGQEPNTAMIGQAIEMDERTGSPNPPMAMTARFGSPAGSVDQQRIPSGPSSVYSEQ